MGQTNIHKLLTTVGNSEGNSDGISVGLSLGDDEASEGKSDGNSEGNSLETTNEEEFGRKFCEDVDHITQQPSLF